MYTIDADRLTIRDLIAMQKASGDIAEQLPILRKCVIIDGGGDIEDLPAKHLRIISQTLLKRISDDSLGN